MVKKKKKKKCDWSSRDWLSLKVSSHPIGVFGVLMRSQMVVIGESFVSVAIGESFISVVIGELSCKWSMVVIGFLWFKDFLWPPFMTFKCVVKGVHDKKLLNNTWNTRHLAYTLRTNINIPTHYILYVKFLFWLAFWNSRWASFANDIQLWLYLWCYIY